jgi:DNA-binding NtrC family response regulator
MVPAAKNIKVLIIDNDNDILDVMNEALTYEGYDVNSLPEIDNIFPK